MKYTFYTKYNYVEIKTWDGKIVNTPPTYRFLLGKPIEKAVHWFSMIKHKMIISPE